MSIKSFFKGIFGSAAGQSVVAAAGTALTQAVAAAAQAGNPIGDAAKAGVAAVESSTMTGAEKKAQVVQSLVPVITALASKNGLNTIVTDVEQFAGMVVEEVVAQMKQTPIVSLAMSLLKLLGFS
jgi:hypothetical protein